MWCGGRLFEKASSDGVHLAIPSPLWAADALVGLDGTIAIKPRRCFMCNFCFVSPGTSSRRCDYAAQLRKEEEDFDDVDRFRSFEDIDDGQSEESTLSKLLRRGRRSESLTSASSENALLASLDVLMYQGKVGYYQKSTACTGSGCSVLVRVRK